MANDKAPASDQPARLTLYSLTNELDMNDAGLSEEQTMKVALEEIQAVRNEKPPCCAVSSEARPVDDRVGVPKRSKWSLTPRFVSSGVPPRAPEQLPADFDHFSQVTFQGFSHSLCLGEQGRPRKFRQADSLIRAISNGRLENTGNDIGCAPPEFASNAHVRSASLRRICLRHICTRLAADVRQAGF